MSSLSSLYGDLSRYRTLLSNVNQLSRIVGNASDALTPAVSKISSCFEIDEVSADAKQISDAMDNLKNQKNYLSSKAIPAIERKISEIEREIEELESEEDDEISA